jgi:uncharacterized membrane protein YukC
MYIILMPKNIVQMVTSVKNTVGYVISEQITPFKFTEKKVLKSVPIQTFWL